MIVQAAVESGCDTLFTEDLQAGRRFDSVEVVNPFDQKAHEPAPKTTKPRSRNR
jgi:predicted nucleic acid-binding protein